MVLEECCNVPITGQLEKEVYEMCNLGEEILEKE